LEGLVERLELELKLLIISHCVWFLGYKLQVQIRKLSLHTIKASCHVTCETLGWHLNDAMPDALLNHALVLEVGYRY